MIRAIDLLREFYNEPRGIRPSGRIIIGDEDKYNQIINKHIATCPQSLVVPVPVRPTHNRFLRSLAESLGHTYGKRPSPSEMYRDFQYRFSRDEILLTIVTHTERMVLSPRYERQYIANIFKGIQNETCRPVVLFANNINAIKAVHYNEQLVSRFHSAILESDVEANSIISLWDYES